MSPMQTVVTRMLSWARSLDRALVMAMPAALEMEVGMDDALGARPPRLVTLIMRPPPTLRISGMTARIKRIAPQTFRLKSDSQSASLTASKGLAMDVPALLTRMSIRPKLLSVISSTRLTVSAAVTSPCTGNTVPPVAVRMSCAAASNTSGRRATKTARAPSEAMRWAAAFPIPSLPPVTMATFPVSPKSMSQPPCEYAGNGSPLYRDPMREPIGVRLAHKPAYAIVSESILAYGDNAGRQTYGQVGRESGTD